METSHFNLDSSLIKFMIHPGYTDYTVKIAYALLNGLKAPFIGTLEISLNGSFVTLANALISNWENQSKGGFGGGTVEQIPKLLIDNDIEIPKSVYLDYEMLRTAKAHIKYPRMWGYFHGEIKGVPSIADIDPKYMKLGALSLDFDGYPLQI